MIIKVEARHCKIGKPRNAACCPVALAMQETVPNNNYAVAYDDELRVGVGAGWTAHSVQCSPPRSVKRFIKRFDKGLPVKPFAFKLNIDPKRPK